MIQGESPERKESIRTRAGLADRLKNYISRKKNRCEVLYAKQSAKSKKRPRKEKKF